MKSILESELTTVDLDEEFEEYVRQCYPESIQVGWMNLDTVSVTVSTDMPVRPESQSEDPMAFGRSKLSNTIHQSVFVL